MNCYRLARPISLPLSFAVAVAVALMLLGPEIARAGILVPQQIGFDANDLDQALDESAADKTSSSSNESPQQTPNQGDQELGPLGPMGFLKSSLPTSGSSSSSSTSSSGGAVGSGVVLCLFNSTVTLRDDSPFGQLAEDASLFLPDPPGTDLLRPPRG